MRLLALVTVALVSGCGTSTLEQKSYSRACGTAADCTPAFFGDVCAYCTCPNGTVGQASLKKYRDDVKNGLSWCGQKPVPVCGPCPEAVVDCVASQCVLK